jgi:hypothetical protein
MHSRFTALFEALVIDWLRETSQRAVARRLGLTLAEVHGIMERAVRRGLARRGEEMIEYLGVDEPSAHETRGREPAVGWLRDRLLEAFHLAFRDGAATSRPGEPARPPPGSVDAAGLKGPRAVPRFPASCPSRGGSPGSIPGSVSNRSEPPV